MSKAGFVVAALVLAASPASAHISLETKQATIGSSYKAVFAVPHGCAGSATIKIRVQIPEGVIGAKPMPKAGWNVEAIKRQIRQRIRLPRQQAHPKASRKWSGAAASCRTTITMNSSSRTFLTGGLKPNTTLYFPVVQECEQGVSRWIDIPKEGGRRPWAWQQVAGARRQADAETLRSRWCASSRALRRC